MDTGINTFNTENNSAILIPDLFSGDILRFIDKTKSNVNGLVGNNSIKNELLLILNFCKKFSCIFKNISEKIEKQLNGNSSTEESNIIKREFLSILYKNIDINIEYQDILSGNCNVVFNEGLLRVNSTNANINHFDFLEIHKGIGLGINTFYLVAERIFKDISEGKIGSPISINAEVSDIMNENFIKIINNLSLKYGVKLNKELIIIEILENEKIPKTKKFKEKIIELKKLGLKIALDDIETNVEKIKESINNIIYLGNNIDIIKLDGKTVQSIYKLYKENKIKFNEIIKDIIIEINNLYKKGIKIIAEWIENIEIYNFVKNILGIKLFQGFYSRDKNNLNLIKNSNK